MLIRSQSKETIINLNCIDSICIGERDGVFAVIAYNGGENTLCGTYAVKEKGIKVLDMLQEEYGKHIFGEGGQMFTRDLYVPAFGFIPPKVFQMPQDEEVEI